MFSVWQIGMEAKHYQLPSSSTLAQVRESGILYGLFVSAKLPIHVTKKVDFGSFKVKWWLIVINCCLKWVYCKSWISYVTGSVTSRPDVIVFFTWHSIWHISKVLHICFYLKHRWHFLYSVLYIKFAEWVIVWRKGCFWMNSLPPWASSSLYNIINQLFSSIFSRQLPNCAIS